MQIHYKIIIVITVIICLIFLFRKLNSKKYDWAQIHSALPYIIIKPTTNKEIQQTIRQYPLLTISIAGQKFSHGGQTLKDNGIYIDMENFNQIIKLDTKRKLITVQSGCTWNQIQTYLDIRFSKENEDSFAQRKDTYNLSVAEMQSYRNFSVGGSICVNCHGRGMKYGTIADTVINMKVILANGNILMVSRNKNSDLFKAIIGSYGGIALILECTLILEDNYPIEMKIIKTNRNEIIKTVNKIKSDPTVIFYNANIYPKNENSVVHITWNRTNKPLTNTTRLQPQQKSFDWKHMGFEQLVRRFDIFKSIRSDIEPKLLANNPQIVWKNYEMSYDANSLEPLFKFPTTSILQEYFIPVNNVEKFLNDFWEIINKFRVNLLNLSLRYVYKTDVPILNYAPEDRIAIVLYLNIGNNTQFLNYAKFWSQILIDRAISYGGTFYLPYLLFASVKQFRLGYPEYKKYQLIKSVYDPKNRFTNHFIDKYIII